MSETFAGDQPIELPELLDRGVYHEYFYQPDGKSVRMFCVSSRGVLVGELFASTVAAMSGVHEELTSMLNALDPVQRPQLNRG